MVRIQWIMKPFPGQNDQAMENVKKFAKLWKDQGANKCTIAIMSGNMWGHIRKINGIMEASMDGC